MKRVVTLFIFISLIISLTACTPKAIDEQLIGTWYQRGIQAWDYEWHFDKNGQVTASIPGSPSNTTEYVAENGTLTIDPHGFSTVYTYKYGQGNDGYEYLFLYDSYGVLKITLRR